MYFGGRKDVEDAEYKSLLSSPKDATGPKPSDVRNGDLVSLLLAATPPYLYNMPLVPQTFFFSEMLRSFVQAKTERQNAKAHQVHRRRKRTWRESTPPKAEPEKPLELTTPRAPEKSSSPVLKRAAASCDFTAEKLANSSVAPEPLGDAPGHNPSMWYPNMYNPAPYPIDPLHFFIDLRVSAHIWDRKLSGDRIGASDEVPEMSPLNLASYRDNAKVDLHKCRHNSAFSVPDRVNSTNNTYERSKLSVHVVMNNLKDIYAKKVEKKDEITDGSSTVGMKIQKELETNELAVKTIDENKNDNPSIELEPLKDCFKQESDASCDDEDIELSDEDDK